MSSQIHREQKPWNDVCQKDLDGLALDYQQTHWLASVRQLVAQKAALNPYFDPMSSMFALLRL